MPWGLWILIKLFKTKHGYANDKSVTRVLSPVGNDANFVKDYGCKQIQLTLELSRLIVIIRRQLSVVSNTSDARVA